MIFVKKSGRWLSISIIVSLFVLWACQIPVKGTRATTARHTLRNLLVIPFKDMSRLYGENVTFRSPLAGRVFTTGKVLDGADRFLTKQMMAMLGRRKDIQLIPSDQAQGVFARLLSTSEKEMPELELIVEIGRSLDADAVLVGYVYRFQEREGTTYSVGTPASVAFNIDLVSVKDSRIIWYGHYKETQQALSEDLFQFGRFIQRKGRWITAWEIAVYGLKDVFQTFPVP